MSQFEEKARELYEVCWRSTTSQEAESAISLALGEAFEAGKSESLRDRAVVNEAPDGSSPFGLPSLSQAESYFGAHGKMLRERALQHPESPLARDLVIAAGWVDSLNFKLQQVRGPDEEAQSADEVSAADQPASLTPPNTPEKAHSASVAPKCDCHLHTHQVCDICQGIERKPQEADEISP